MRYLTAPFRFAWNVTYLVLAVIGVGFLAYLLLFVLPVTVVVMVAILVVLVGIFTKLR